METATATPKRRRGSCGNRRNRKASSFCLFASYLSGTVTIGAWAIADGAGLRLPEASQTWNNVSCGSDRRANCSECSKYGGGPTLCLGDCRWHHGKCLSEADAVAASQPGDPSIPRGFPLPSDTRPAQCRRSYSDDITDRFLKLNLTVSVVIPWLKEKWEHMEGTLKALEYFTPSALIEEYIFVSDGNEDAREKELKAISNKVKVIALPERNGLIKAKNKGVALAKAPVLVFMEAHCIVNRFWLEPLLDRVAANPHVLAMPQLDYIPDRDWHLYFASSPGHWRYEWNFNLIFTNPLGVGQQHEPYPSPGTSGGIFAMRRDWFQHLGLFDPYMLEWGGDHFELTMKVWRCGGRIEIVPCSRIGHLFRQPDTRPYSVSEWQVIHNYARLAKVWIPDHMHLFYKVKPQAYLMWLGDTSEQIKKREELQCKSMDWYIENVDVELKWEADKLCFWTWNPTRYYMWCESEPPPGRSVVAKMMPRGEYREAREAADKRLAQEALRAQRDREARGAGGVAAAAAEDKEEEEAKVAQALAANTAAANAAANAAAYAAYAAAAAEKAEKGGDVGGKKHANIEAVAKANGRMSRGPRSKNADGTLRTQQEEGDEEEPFEL